MTISKTRTGPTKLIILAAIVSAIPVLGAATARGAERSVEVTGTYIQTFRDKERMVCRLLVTARNHSSRSVSRLVVGYKPDPYARRHKAPDLPAKMKKAVEVEWNLAGRDCLRREFKELKILECRYTDGTSCLKASRARILPNIKDIHVR